jgi:hypothetical protein
MKDCIALKLLKNENLRKVIEVYEVAERQKRKENCRE